MPKAGGTYVDRTFGTTIMRLTDASDSENCHHSYSYYPSLNKNNTRLFVCCDGKPVLFRFAPDGFKLIGEEPLSVGKPPSGYQPRTVLELHNDWGQDYVVSLLADNEGWALVSFYTGNTLPSSGVFRGEIVQVATDGSRRVRRLAHHRTVYREYWDSPRANISRDGSFVIYTSNFGGRARRDVFILRVPPTNSRDR
ncbi:MAG: hypothetical protein ACYSWU_17385 [Planctomycetota bacterium]